MTAAGGGSRVPGSTVVTHALAQTPAGTATLSDITAADIDAIVRYWHCGGEAHLDALGIDRALLGTPQDTRQRFVRAVRSGALDQPNIACAINLNGVLVGYTLLNRYAPEINYSHWHITAPELRGARISSALYPHRIKMYFDLTPMTRLIHQTRTSNVGVNRMLDKYVPVAETRYIDRPDGVAAAGEFHLRYVSRSDVPALFERAAQLRASAG